MHQMGSFRGIPAAPEYVVAGNTRICRILVAEAFQWILAFRPIIKRANANKHIQDRFGSHAWNSRRAIMLDALCDPTKHASKPLALLIETNSP